MNRNPEDKGRNLKRVIQGTTGCVVPLLRLDTDWSVHGLSSKALYKWLQSISRIPIAQLAMGGLQKDISMQLWTVSREIYVLYPLFYPFLLTLKNKVKIRFKTTKRLISFACASCFSFTGSKLLLDIRISPILPLGNQCMVVDTQRCYKFVQFEVESVGLQGV